jgi:hypothetical protein
MEWAVAATVAGRESKAIADLARAGVDVADAIYCPVIAAPPKAIRGKIIEPFNPIFPGYVFVRLTECWRDAQRGGHVLDLLRNGEGKPSTVPQDVIDGDTLSRRAGWNCALHFDEGAAPAHARQKGTYESGLAQRACRHHQERGRPRPYHGSVPTARAICAREAMLSGYRL